MTDRARDRDRDAAIRTVDAAYAAGRIIQADRDKRVEEIRFAHNLQDIAVQVGDLATPVTAPVAAAPMAAPMSAAPVTAATVTAASGPARAAAPAQPAASTYTVSYGPAQGGTLPIAAMQTAARRARGIGGIVMAIVLVSIVVPVVGTIIALVSSARSFDFEGTTGTQPTDESTYLPGQSPGPDGVNVLTTDGYQALVTALQSQVGSTSVYSAVVYPRYAALDVPDGSGVGHYTDYYWDGHELTGQSFKSSSEDQTLDLATVDPQLMIAQLAIVRGRVTDPNSWYCIVYHPTDQQTQVACYASNEYNDTSYTVVGLDGTTLYDSATQS